MIRMQMLKRMIVVMMMMMIHRPSLESSYMYILSLEDPK